MTELGHLQTNLEKKEKELEKILSSLHQEIANITSRACGNCLTHGETDLQNTFPINQCCDDLICAYIQAKLLLKGIHIEETGNKNARFADKNGCVVPADLRPVCSVHWCKKVIDKIKKENPKRYIIWNEKKKRLEKLYRQFKRIKKLMGKDDIISDLVF